jgi:hypothetical protein
MAGGNAIAMPPSMSGRTAADKVSARLDTLFRTIVAAMLGGWLCGFAIAGVLGRLVMRVLASESSQSVKGMLTDDREPVGEITLGGSTTLALTGGFAGAAAALGYLLALRIIPTSTTLRMLIFAIFGASVGGALFVHSYDSFDYSRLEPVSFAVAAFILLPALFGLVIPPVVDTLARPDGWIAARAPMWLLIIGSIVLSGFAIVVTSVAIGAAFLVQSIEPLRRIWLSRFATIAGVAIFSVLIVLGVTDLAVDIDSIRAEEPRTCPVCLDD